MPPGEPGRDDASQARGHHGPVQVTEPAPSQPPRTEFLRGGDSEVKHSVTVVPWPTTELSRRVPQWTSMICLQSASPRPVPGIACALLPRVKGSMTFSSSAAGIPMPLSAMTTVRPSPATCAWIVMTGFSGPRYLIAFATRLRKSSLIKVGFPRIVGSSVHVIRASLAAISR